MGSCNCSRAYRGACVAGRTGSRRARAPRSGPRHVAALQQLRGGPVTVGELASLLGLTLPTVSGVLADLDRAGFIDRQPDPADRRRTLVRVQPAQAAVVEQWLDGAASPLARVLDKLAPSERTAFLKAMNMLEEELTADDASP